MENEKIEENVIVFEVPLKLGDKEVTELKFRRPTGRDVASIMNISNPAEKIHQLARVLCEELNFVDDEQFYNMDYGHHYKHIGNMVEGFM